MYQTTVKCKSLRLATKFNEGCNQKAKGTVELETVKLEDLVEYTEASLEGNDNNTHFFFNFPVSLLDENMRIGDEILVTFERKYK